MRTKQWIYSWLFLPKSALERIVSGIKVKYKDISISQYFKIIFASNSKKIKYWLFEKERHYVTKKCFIGDKGSIPHFSYTITLFTLLFLTTQASPESVAYHTIFSILCCPHTCHNYNPVVMSSNIKRSQSPVYM